MSPTAVQDREQLDRFFERLHSDTSAWMLFKSHVPLLTRHSEEVIRTCNAALPKGDLSALRSTIVLICLGEHPDLAILEAAYMSEKNRIVAASTLDELVPRQPYPELLAMAERVCAESRNAYAVMLSVKLAARLRGQAADGDFAALERINAAQPDYAIDATLWSLLNRSRHDKARGLALFDRLLETQPITDSLVSSFASHADETRIPRLWLLLRTKESRSSVLAALVRLKADGIRDTLLTEIKGSEWQPILPHLTELLRGTNDQEAIQRLVDRFATPPMRSESGKHFAIAVAAIGGPASLPVVEQLLGDLPGHLKAPALLEARGITLDAALDELVQVGFINGEQRKRAMGKRRRPSLSARILDALESCGAALRFDAEHTVTPVPHEDLVMDLANLSQAAFAPTGVEQDGPHPGVDEGAYTVKFGLGPKRYEFRCGDQSGWYDHRAVADHVNRALNDTALAERFIEIDADGQYPTYVFADPAAAAEAARRGLIVWPSASA